MSRMGGLDTLSGIQAAYREAVAEGGERASRLIRALYTETLLPRPWWFGDVISSLHCAAAGQEPFLTPDEFDAYEIFEAKTRMYREASSVILFNPYKDEERREGFLTAQKSAVDALLDLARFGENPFTSFDDQIALLLATLLERAINAGQAGHYPIAEKLQDFVAHYDHPRCAPVPENVASAVLSLRKAIPLLG